MNTINEDTKRLIADVSAAAGGVGGGEVRERPRHYLEIGTLFDRCRSTYGAVVLLAGKGFGQEAVALGRSLFTESLMLAELAEADQQRRAQLVVGWSLASADSFEGVFREAKATGDDVEEQLDAVRSLKRDLEDYARRNRVGTRRWKPDEKKLAKKHGADYYLDFLVAHQFVHGSTFAASQRFTKKDDIAFIGGPARQGGWALPAVLGASQWLVSATRSICKIMEYPEPEHLDELFERAEAIGCKAGILPPETSS